MINFNYKKNILLGLLLTLAFIVIFVTLQLCLVPSKFSDNLILTPLCETHDENMYKPSKTAELSLVFITGIYELEINSTEPCEDYSINNITLQLSNISI